MPEPDCPDPQQTTDDNLSVSLGDLPFAIPMEDGQRANPTASAGTSAPAMRFHILRHHARGGLGEVFLARDTELHREVALKEIQDPHADANSRARFVLEAEITGRLEHPGIVPVYGLGQYADGRPYYAMRFIKGERLEDAIAQFHRAELPGRDAGERALALRQLLRRFVDVCNAVAYAHSRGVLHCDLKPANIMLGPYGETLVVDWGLAKVLGQRSVPEGDAEPVLQPVTADNVLPTRLGAVIGTPAFMSPEQASGQRDQLEPASDVYSLGAILYCLLAGKLPFADRDMQSVLAKVQRGEFPPPREVKPEVPPALEAVCLKAMSLRPADRYASPGELAADVERWLADEPVKAWREPWRVRVGRWARRHQKSVAALAAGLLVTLLATGAGLWWLDRLRSEQRRDVEAALTEVSRLQGEARWSEARAVLGQTEGRLGEGGPKDLRQRLEKARSDMELVARLDAIHTRKTTVVKGGLFDDRGADQAYEQALREAGLGEVGSDPSAAAEWVSSSAVREMLIAVLDDWAGCTKDRKRRAWLLEVTRRADPDPWRDAARDPATWENAAALTRLADNKRWLDQSPRLLAALAGQLDSLGGNPEILLRPAQERYPTDFWLNLELGNALASKKPEEAIGYYRVALALRPGSAAVYLNLGIVLSDEDQLDEAIAAYHKAIELNPRYASAYNSLGNALDDKGLINEAIAAYRKAIDIEHTFSMAYNNLGIALRKMDRLDEAIAAHRKAIEINPRYANAYNGLGMALHDKGRLDDALAAYRRAIEIDPEDADTRNNLGVTLRDKGLINEAIAAYRKAIEADPKDTMAYNNLGNALREKGRLEDALAVYRKAIEIAPKQTWPRTNLADTERMLAVQTKLAAVLAGRARPAGAVEQLGLAHLCLVKKLNAASARFYAGAFAADPRLTADPSPGHRYNAACAAALASTGKGQDAAGLTDKERSRLCRQALDWLRADLDYWSKYLEKCAPQERATVRDKLRYWQHHSDLVSLRDPALGAKLPEAERADCRKLWADVAALLQK